jgi:gamma-glutamyltranspeptidase/glutathione hydrolase
VSIDSLSGVASEQDVESLRPTITGTKHVASAGHYLAAQAALQILEAGGNAIDAGVAAGLVMGVVQSELVNIAGVAPIILYWAQADEIVTISGLGGWPRAVDPELFVREHNGAIPHGLLRTVVPAAPDAWITALRLYGTLSFGDVAGSAIAFARDGFVMYPHMAQLLKSYAEGYARWPSSAEIYLPGGQPPNAGDIFVQRDLARTLQYMVDCESAARSKGRDRGLDAARDAFYRGDIARAIVHFHETNGGLLTMEDMADFRANIEPPESLEFRGARIYACGPWCQGPTLLQMLSILDGIDFAGFGHNSAQYVHTLVEVMKLSFADRHRFFGDPRFVDVPIKRLLNAGYCAHRRALIGEFSACGERASINERQFTQGAPTGGPIAAQIDPAALDTSYVAVIDDRGNVFSATPSDVSYDTPVIPGTGLCPSSRGSQSWADPTCPSSVAPGKRPRLTPAPFLARHANGTITALGTPGGDVQLQALLQVWLNVEAFEMPLQAAVEAARFATYDFPDSFEPHQTYPGRVNVESRFGSEQIVELRRRGHDVAMWPNWAWRAGAVCVARRRAGGGVLEAAADPRRPAYAVGR